MAADTSYYAVSLEESRMLLCYRRTGLDATVNLAEDYGDESDRRQS